MFGLRIVQIDRGIRPAGGGKGPWTCRERNPVLPNLVAEPTLSLWVVYRAGGLRGQYTHETTSVGRVPVWNPGIYRLLVLIPGFLFKDFVM